MQLRARYNNKLHKAQDDSIALQEAMDNLNWSYSQKKEELMELDQQVKQLADRYKEEQEVRPRTRPISGFGSMTSVAANWNDQ